MSFQGCRGERPPVRRRCSGRIQEGCQNTDSRATHLAILKGFNNPAQGRLVLGQWGDGPTLGNRVKSSPTLKAVASSRQRHRGRTPCRLRQEPGGCHPHHSDAEQARPPADPPPARQRQRLRPSRLSTLNSATINHSAAKQAALPLENDQRAQLTIYNTANSRFQQAASLFSGAYRTARATPCKSSLLTQRQHLLSLRMGLGLLIQQVGDADPTAHL